jgi:hypothetical protein
MSEAEKQALMAERQQILSKASAVIGLSRATAEDIEREMNEEERKEEEKRMREENEWEEQEESNQRDSSNNARDSGAAVPTSSSSSPLPSLFNHDALSLAIRNVYLCPDAPAFDCLLSALPATEEYGGMIPALTQQSVEGWRREAERVSEEDECDESRDERTRAIGSHLLTLQWPYIAHLIRCKQLSTAKSMIEQAKEALQFNEGQQGEEEKQGEEQTPNATRNINYLEILYTIAEGNVAGGALMLREGIKRNPRDMRLWRELSDLYRSRREEREAILLSAIDCYHSSPHSMKENKENFSYYYHFLIDLIREWIQAREGHKVPLMRSMLSDLDTLCAGECKEAQIMQIRQQIRSMDQRGTE